MDKSNPDYDWIIIELFDQMVRNQSGGFMAEYISQDKIENEEYIFERIGNEAKKIRNSYLGDIENQLQNKK
jgi:hypothetical protein